MSSYSEFHVEFNGYSPINRNDPQQVEIFGPASLKKDINKSIAEFSSVFAQSVMICKSDVAKWSRIKCSFNLALVEIIFIPGFVSFRL